MCHTFLLYVFPMSYGDSEFLKFDSPFSRQIYLLQRNRLDVLIPLD